MSQQHIETTTIVSDGNTIIIAHPNPKPEASFWDTFSSLLASNQPSPATIPSQNLPISAVETLIVQEVPVSLEIKPVQAVVQVLAIEAVPIVEDTTSWTDYFSRQSITSYRKAVKDQIKSLEGIDQRLSRGITKFKEQKLLSLGDVRARSILMAFSSALMYKLISVNTVGFLRKTRNLGGSFVFMGYWFVPQLFNPFLRRPSLAQNIV